MVFISCPQQILGEILKPHLEAESLSQHTVHNLFLQFGQQLENRLLELAQSPNERVVGFKSIICYRTGLDVSLGDSEEVLERALDDVFLLYCKTGEVRLKTKPLNDYILRTVLDLCRRTGKPSQCLASDSLLASSVVCSPTPYWPR